MIFVINKQARAQARAKPNSAELNTHTHARTYEQSGHYPSRMRALDSARTIGQVSKNTFCFISFCSYNKQTSAKTQLVSWLTIISISVRSSFVLDFCVNKKPGTENNHQYMLCLSAKRFSFMKSKPRPLARREARPKTPEQALSVRKGAARQIRAKFSFQVLLPMKLY